MWSLTSHHPAQVADPIVTDQDLGSPDRLRSPVVGRHRRLCNPIRDRDPAQLGGSTHQRTQGSLLGRRLNPASVQLVFEPISRELWDILRQFVQNRHRNLRPLNRFERAGNLLDRPLTQSSSLAYIEKTLLTQCRYLRCSAAHAFAAHSEHTPKR